MNDRLNAVRAPAPAQRDRSPINADVVASNQPQDLADAEPEDRLALVDYDSVDWDHVTDSSTHHGRVVRHRFERLLAEMSSRTWGWAFKDYVREEILVSEVEQPHAYDILDWAYATLLATSNGRVNKYIFDIAISHVTPSTHRQTRADETRAANARPQNRSPRMPEHREEHPNPLRLEEVPSVRRSVQQPPTPAIRHSTRRPAHLPPPGQLPPIRSPSCLVSPPPRYTSHPPDLEPIDSGSQAPPPRYTSRVPERTQSRAVPQSRTRKRSQLPASPQSGRGRDRVRSRSPVRREVEYYPGYVVPVTRNGQRILVSQRRIPRERNRAADRRDVHRAARQSGRDVIALD